MSSSDTTTIHDEIRKWAEDRRPPRSGAHRRRGWNPKDRFREPEENSEEVSWGECFKIFDESKLAFLPQDKTHDRPTSRFNKFISRD